MLEARTQAIIFKLKSVFQREKKKEVINYNQSNCLSWSVMFNVHFLEFDDGNERQPGFVACGQTQEIKQISQIQDKRRKALRERRPSPSSGHIK